MAEAITICEQQQAEGKLWRDLAEVTLLCEQPQAQSMNPEEGGGRKHTSIDGKKFKKSPSVWSSRDYLCEDYGKTFTQCHTLQTPGNTIVRDAKQA